MSSSQWHQVAGDRAMRAWSLEQTKLVTELRELLSAFIDESSLPGHAVTQEQWERACFLCGRWTKTAAKRIR